LTTFYFILLFGFGAFVVITFIFGEIFEFGGHVLDGIGHVFDGISGAHDASILDAAGGDGSVAHPLGFRTISAFGAGFGAGGLIGLGLGMSEQTSLLPATGVGLAMAGAMWAFLEYITTQQGTTSIEPRDYYNLIARVSTSIPGKGMGQVSVTIKGEIKDIPAISSSGATIPTQTQVYIESMEGGVATVKPMSQPEA
jgi:hypothetical protein